ncbi:MAG: 2-oxoglutarate oxidoreductase [Oscillospiraceae bacterium]|nr:2-oxoglutarate oxidoreductase [Oscillospiraceae bacterium]
MKPVFTYTKGMVRTDTSYCPGCTHGIAHRLITETLEEMGMLGKAIGVAPIGCAVQAHKFMNVDMCESAHGRAPAVASGVRRVHPDKIVFTYQGDGDLASIGTAEIVHAAARGEKFTTFFINNCIYGMTGGQMAPTTLLGQRSTTSQDGRKKEQAGSPIRVSEMLATLEGAVYIERVSLASPAHIRNAKKAVRRAFEIQQTGAGFTFVEFLSTCPTNWGVTPPDAMKWLIDNMLPYYPLGVYREPTSEEVAS